MYAYGEDGGLIWEARCTPMAGERGVCLWWPAMVVVVYARGTVHLRSVYGDGGPVAQPDGVRLWDEGHQRAPVEAAKGQP